MTPEELAQLAPIFAALRDAHLRVQAYEGIQRSHARKAAELRSQAAAEEANERDGFQRRIEEWNAALAQLSALGGVPETLRLGTDQVVVALPGDYVWIYQRAPQGGFEELLLEPVERDEGGIIVVNEERKVVGADRTVRWPRTYVAPKASDLPVLP
jgi:hypothetical protein